MFGPVTVFERSGVGSGASGIQPGGVRQQRLQLAHARRALYAGMIALSDALIGAAEPETAITIAWPDAITVNLGEATSKVFDFHGTAMLCRDQL